METFMNGAIVVEAALLSFFLALWLTWLSLRSLIRLMPATGRPTADRAPQPIRLAARRRSEAA